MSIALAVSVLSCKQDCNESDVMISRFKSDIQRLDSIVSISYNDVEMSESFSEIYNKYNGEIVPGRIISAINNPDMRNKFEEAIDSFQSCPELSISALYWLDQALTVAEQRLSFNLTPIITFTESKDSLIGSVYLAVKLNPNDVLYNPTDLNVIEQKPFDFYSFRISKPIRDKGKTCRFNIKKHQSGFESEYIFESIWK